MKLIIGLGNPGKEYEKTRHNIGFAVIEGFGVQVLGFSDWKLDKKSKAEIAKSEIDGEKVILAKPQTFMNNSGDSIKILTKTYNLKPNNLFIVHDDLDLPLGTMRLSFGSGSAGHNGVQSIIDSLGTKNFWRLRIGIGPQKGKSESFVLKRFLKEEQKTLKEVIDRTSEALSLALQNPEKAMSQFN